MVRCCLNMTVLIIYVDILVFYRHVDVACYGDRPSGRITGMTR